MFKPTHICYQCQNLNEEHEQGCNANERTAPRRTEECFPFNDKKVTNRVMAVSDNPSESN